MSTLNGNAPAPGERSVPAQARRVAARRSALFDQDRLIVGRLNDAQRQLASANERLWSGLAPDAFGLIYDGAAPAGHSQIAGLIDWGAGQSGSRTAVLCALQQTHWAIRRAFHAYEDASEQRRQLAVEVGELAQRLTGVLVDAGWSAQDAQDADVHQLARRAAHMDGRWDSGR